MTPKILIDISSLNITGLIMIITLSCLIVYTNAFYFRSTKLFPTYLSSFKDDKVPPVWNLLSISLKEHARKWFIKRAILKGIDWEKMTDYYKLSVNFDELQQLKLNIENCSVNYPEYFLKPFHGYDDGNMNWLAAQENEAAALSMCANYWNGICAMDSQEWVRYNVSLNIESYIGNDSKNIDNILDVGCSGGISTEYLKKGFPQASSIYGLDLSPYFLSVGTFRSKKQKTNIQYIHANAEQTPFPDNIFDIIACNFLFHEVPPKATQTILHEMMRILSPGGVLVIVDIDPENLKNDAILSQFRKWAFEVTEPHIYNYYGSNITRYLEDCGFENVLKKSNDPINSIWLGRKNSNLLLPTTYNVKTNSYVFYD